MGQLLQSASPGRLQAHHRGAGVSLVHLLSDFNQPLPPSSASLYRPAEGPNRRVGVNHSFPAPAPTYSAASSSPPASRSIEGGSRLRPHRRAASGNLCGAPNAAPSASRPSRGAWGGAESGPVMGCAEPIRQDAQRRSCDFAARQKPGWEFSLRGPVPGCWDPAGAGCGVRSHSSPQRPSRPMSLCLRPARAILDNI